MRARAGLHLNRGDLSFFASERSLCQSSLNLLATVSVSVDCEGKALKHTREMPMDLEGQH
jgi:hypothetical protein